MITTMWTGIETEMANNNCIYNRPRTILRFFLMVKVCIFNDEGVVELFQELEKA